MNVPYGPILVVEDVPHILNLLEVTLSFKGYSIVTARNGQEALECIAVARPAMIITDILMPRLDGFSLVQKLRTDPKTSDIPIVFLSATYVTHEDKQFALNLGAVRFLEKPVDTEEFLLTVAEVLTAGPSTVPKPMGDREFYLGYRQRLENKLRHKIGQIQRAERLLESLPEDQRPTFQALLDDSRSHRDEIQRELDELFNLIEQYSNNDNN
jgi:CheY-like chemotaxis protein